MTNTRESSVSVTRPRRIASVGTLLLAVTGLVGALAPPASAMTLSGAQGDRQPARADHRIVHHDARHDVLHFESMSDRRRPAPRDRATDVTRTVVDHQAEQLVIKARARQLRRSGYRLMVAEILTSDSRRFTLVVDYSTTPIDSRMMLERFGTAREVSCPDASWSASRATDQVIASVPASCLGAPEWVRVGVALTAAPHHLRTSRADDSRARGRIGDRHLRHGPRQHRA